MRIKFYGQHPTREVHRLLKEEFTVVNKRPDVIWTDLTPVVNSEGAKLICTPCTGTDHIKVDVPVLNLWDKDWLEWNVYATAEHTMALILCVAKNMFSNMLSPDSHRTERTKLSMDLHGRRLLIVGNGRVGRQVSRMAKGFGMVVDTVEKGDLKELVLDKLCRADVVSFHIPLDGNENLVDLEWFDAMKDGTIVVNTSRSGIFDEYALMASYHRLRFALDVTESYSDSNMQDLFDAGVITTPHVAGYSDISRQKTDMWLAEKLILWRDRHGHN